MNTLPQLTIREREKLKLDRLRGISERLLGDQWNMEADDDGIHVVTFRATGEEVKILTIHHEATIDEQDLIAGALDHLFFFLGFVGRAVRRVHELRAELDRLVKQSRADNHGFQAKKLCESVAFWRFLEGTAGGAAVTSATAADARIKCLLQIASKADLNKDAAARDRFFRLRSDFYAWQRSEGQ